jgi:hypothetical protein
MLPPTKCARHAITLGDVEHARSWLVISFRKSKNADWCRQLMARYIRPKLKADNVGLGWVDYRVMRRTHSSLMNAHGVDPKVIADQQGHTVDVNLNVYTQTSVESRREAAETLGSAFVN